MDKLEQKFQDIIIDYSSIHGLNIDKVTSKSAELTKDIAVKFACWADDNYWRIGCSNLWQDSPNFEDKEAFKYTTQELFDKFLEKYE